MLHLMGSQRVRRDWVTELKADIKTKKEKKKKKKETKHLYLPVCVGGGSLTWISSNCKLLPPGFPDVSVVKNSLANAGDSGDSLGEKMATHPNIFAWETLWIEEPGGLQSMGSQELDRLSDWTVTATASPLTIISTFPLAHQSLKKSSLLLLKQKFVQDLSCIEVISFLLPQSSWKFFFACLTDHIQFFFYSMQGLENGI